MHDDFVDARMRSYVLDVMQLRFRLHDVTELCNDEFARSYACLREFARVWASLRTFHTVAS